MPEILGWHYVRYLVAKLIRELWLGPLSIFFQPAEKSVPCNVTRALSTKCTKPYRRDQHYTSQSRKTPSGGSGNARTGQCGLKCGGTFFGSTRD